MFRRVKVFVLGVTFNCVRLETGSALSSLKMFRSTLLAKRSFLFFVGVFFHYHEKVCVIRCPLFPARTDFDLNRCDSVGVSNMMRSVRYTFKKYLR